MSNKIKAVIIAAASVVLALLMLLCVFLESRTLPAGSSGADTTTIAGETTIPVGEETTGPFSETTPPQESTGEVAPPDSPAEDDSSEPAESEAVTTTTPATEPHQTDPADDSDGENMSDWA